MFLTILLALAGLGSLVCLIIVLTKLFPAEGTGKGILGILCALYTFIWGWQHKDEYDIQNVIGYLVDSCGRGCYSQRHCKQLRVILRGQSYDLL